MPLRAVTTANDVDAEPAGDVARRRNPPVEQRSEAAPEPRERRDNEQVTDDALCQNTSSLRVGERYTEIADVYLFELRPVPAVALLEVFLPVPVRKADYVEQTVGRDNGLRATERRNDISARTCCNAARKPSTIRPHGLPSVSVL